MFRKTALLLFLLVVGLLFSTSVTLARPVEDADDAQNYEWVFVDNPVFSGIFQVEADPSNPVDGWDQDRRVVVRQDGSTAGTVGQFERQEGCSGAIDSNGECDDSFTSYSEISLGSLTRVEVDNTTGAFSVLTRTGERTNISVAGEANSGPNAPAEEPEPTDTGSTSNEEVVGPDASCESAILALGWILCPFTEFLVDSLEVIVRDGIVRNILEFNALSDADENIGTGGENPGEVLNSSDSRAALQSVWQGFRAIANLGFVIAFMIIIYSAASGNALSAYDTKRMIPRLLIGAVAVQVSFFITTELVDLFNALGNGIVDLMLLPINGEANAGTGALWNDSNLDFGWFRDIGSALLLILLILGTLASIGGVLLMIFVFLLRNMALMILTVISPLAFVAWILPNTEGMFKKWWGAYIQLLAMFPIAMAFLASGRLVSFIWASGDGFAAQWVGMIALFAPYIAAPKMFSFAGNAISGVIRGVDGARNGTKGRFAKLRGSEAGKRIETGIKSSAADRLGARYEPGGKGSKFGQKIASSKMGQRALAAPTYAQRQIEDQDMAAASILQKNSVARLRSAAVASTVKAPGMTDDEFKKEQDDRAGKAEIKFLTDTLKNATSSDASKRAAAKTLVDVHSSDLESVKTLHDFIQEGNRSGDRGTQQLTEKIVQENIGGLLGDLPQSIKGFSGAANQPTKKVINMKGSSTQHIAESGDVNAVASLARKYVEAAQNENLRGDVSDGNASEVLKGMMGLGWHNPTNANHAIYQEFANQFNVSAPAGGKATANMKPL